MLEYGYPLYPWERDWSQFYIYHWHLCDYDWDTCEPLDGAFGLPDVAKTLDQIKRIDKITRSIPKVVVLIGWQEFVKTQGGTAPWDCQWPSFVTTSKLFDNPKGKYTDSLDNNPANAAIRWLMKKAREECNTYATFHTNLNGVQPHSSHWETYVQKDLLCKDMGGNYHHDQYIKGYVHLQRAFETGEFQKRIDELMDTFPEIKETKLLHNDWNWNMFSEYHGYTQDESMAAQRKCMEYIKKTYGVDVSCELVTHRDLKKEFDYGMQCRALTFHREDAAVNPDRMTVPAYIFLGSDGGPNDPFDIPDYNADGKNTAGFLRYSNETLLFGASTQGNVGRYYTGSSEDEIAYHKYITPDAKNGVFGPNALFRDFCYATLPMYYLNRLLRLGAIRNGDRYASVRFSEGVRSYYKTGSLSDGSVVIEKEKGGIGGSTLTLRDGNNLFFPAIWKLNREIFAFSDDGYTDRQWALPMEWEGVTSVDLYDNTVTGTKLRHSGISVKNGVITLSLDKRDGVIIAPSGENPENLKNYYDVSKSAPVHTSGFAELIKIDVTTGGYWIGAYGSEGWAIPGIEMEQHLPPYARVKLSGGKQAVFHNFSEDKYSLQNPYNSYGKRCGEKWEAILHQIIDVDVGDEPMFVSIYFLDRDNQNFQSIIEPIDAWSNERIGCGKIKSSVLINDCKKGKYAVYKINGRIRFRITRFHFDHYGNNKTGTEHEAGFPAFCGLFFDRENNRI